MTTPDDPASTPPPPERLASLDGLRGLAACGVGLLYHAQSLFAGHGFAGEPEVLHWFHLWGWTLVDLFFLISGYIFAHVYLAPEGRLRREAMGDFALARAARLYPLHLLMLVACAALFTSNPANTPLSFLVNLLMMQGFVASAAHSFDGPSWSISVEVVCYALFALAATRGSRAVRRTSVAAVAVAVVWLLAWGRAGGPWFGDSLPRGLLGFFIGQLLWQARGSLSDVPSALLALLLILGLMLDAGPLSPVLPLSLYAWPALLLLALRTHWLGAAPMRWLGDRSYAIYLVHQPIVLLAERHFGPFAADLPTFAGITVVLGAMVLALSDVAHRLVEVPARRAIRAAWGRRVGTGAVRRTA